MSDFIKVNLKNGDFIVVHKINLALFTMDNDYLASTNFAQGKDMSGYFILKEEYDRLCEELGVE